MKILVTGADGFIGKNLVVRLGENPPIEVVPITSNSSADDLRNSAKIVDFVFHLAGANRPANPADFNRINIDFTRDLVEALTAAGRRIPVIFTSSRKAGEDSLYGKSKRDGEQALLKYRETGGVTLIYRLPNVFGKWCRPNYNSAVATFCNNIAHGLPITVTDPNAALELVYIDDVIDHFIALLKAPSLAAGFGEVTPTYQTTVGVVADLIRSFHDSRQVMQIEQVGTGLIRALYSTYLSYFDPTQFSYPLKKHEDSRGSFSEILKTKDSGQFSFFTAHPGITRGGHYHHTKVEKFLIVEGSALFKFRHIKTNDYYELRVEGSDPTVVETVPGWAHDVTNVGEGVMIALLWANEVFDPERPDTISRGLT